MAHFRRLVGAWMVASLVPGAIAWAADDEAPPTFAEEAERGLRAVEPTVALEAKTVILSGATVMTAAGDVFEQGRDDQAQERDDRGARRGWRGRDGAGWWVRVAQGVGVLSAHTPRELGVGTTPVASGRMNRLIRVRV